MNYARVSGQALTRLVEDVTLLSRADEGSLALRCAPVDGLELARRALRTVELAADARSVRLSLRVEGEALSLEGDGERLAHALAKLLENAVKFSPEGGEVMLTVAASDGAVHFVTRDEGIGVAPEDAEHIFMRFYQAERTAKSHPGGYGLGLTVARVIAMAHGGAIRVESAPEQGATFTLSCPDQRDGECGSAGGDEDQAWRVGDSLAAIIAAINRLQLEACGGNRVLHLLAREQSEPQLCCRLSDRSIWRRDREHVLNRHHTIAHAVARNVWRSARPVRWSCQTPCSQSRPMLSARRLSPRGSRSMRSFPPACNRS